jgi:hypothetical protein
LGLKEKGLSELDGLVGIVAGGLEELVLGDVVKRAGG